MTKTKEKFLKDIEVIYDEVSKNNVETAKYLDFKDEKRRNYLEKFLNDHSIRVCDESIYAIAVRLVYQKREAMVQFLKSEGVDDKTIDKICMESYYWVRGYYEQVFEELLGKIESEDLLTPFYREVLNSCNEIGKLFNQWFPKWRMHLIETLNPELASQFGEKNQIIEYLREHDLMDIGHFDEEADRSYSIICEEEGNYVVKAYVDAFEEVEKIVDKLLEFKSNLVKFSDDIYELDDAYQIYIQSLIDAFSETDRSKLIEKWCDADIKWMDVTSPIQMTHFQEYYDDHYRKSVEIEFDVRLINPRYAKNMRAENVKEMYSKMFSRVGEGYEKILDMCKSNVERTQLYIGKPILFYGSFLEKSYSAQVIPNDTVASEKKGKKIFAFPDLVLESSRERPFMKLPKMIFEESHIRAAREFLFNETQKWHEIYDIETIGHEYGHILWLDGDTEVIMNAGGNFKNIEELKATCGGLVSYFLDDNRNKELDIEFVRTLMSRAVGLIAWMKVGEVQPYYCEGLIHLKGLFNCGVLSWSSGEKVKVTINGENFEKLKTWYIEMYSNLASTYLKKINADEFLFQYATKQGEDYLPVDEHIREFVLWVYDLYQKHGNEVDTEDRKENYIIVD